MVTDGGLRAAVRRGARGIVQRMRSAGHEPDRELVGSFKIVGYNSVGKDSNGRNRVEFDLVASDAKLSKSLAGRVVQGNIRGHSSEYLDARTVRGAE
jgi:hypothetical protein